MSEGSDVTTPEETVDLDEAVVEEEAIEAPAEAVAVADSDATIVSDASRDDIRKNMAVNMREKAARLKG
jgi:hypothetical protein